MENSGATDRSVDVKSIVQEIRRDIEAKGYTDDTLGFMDTVDERLLADIATFRDVEDTQRDLSDIGYTWCVQFYRPFTGHKLTVFVKKVIRKLIKFQLLAILNDQNAFNRSVARLIEKNHRQETKIAELSDRLLALEALVREDRSRSCQSTSNE